MPVRTGTAKIKWAGDEYFIGTTPSGHSQVLDPKADRRSAASPVELLLLALAGCTAADVISILEKKRQDVTEYIVEIHGDRRDEHPRGFLSFNVHHIVHGRSVSEGAVDRAIRLSEDKYCSVAATVRPAAKITTSFEIIEVGSDDNA